MIDRRFVSAAAPGYTRLVADALSVMQARYATCASYEDRGTSVTVSTYEDGQPPRSETLTFSTLFDRATGAFRFEYEQRNRCSQGTCAVFGPHTICIVEDGRYICR